MKALAGLRGRLEVAVTRRLPNDPVVRVINGVEMTMPRRHLLPVFTRGGSSYGLNLVRLARRLGEDVDNLCFLDVGANIGDSVLQVLAATPGEAVCVEPDSTWLPFLVRNTRDLAVAIEPSILVGSATADALAIVSEYDGSSRLVRADGAEASTAPAITTDALLGRHPRLSGVRLIKSDTDGYDVALAPALARTFLGSTPVLFFEYDPAQTRLAMPEVDPLALWPALDQLGYRAALVWDNAGRVLGSAACAELATRAAAFDLPARRRGYVYWDVAVAHEDDIAGGRALADLATELAAEAAW